MGRGEVDAVVVCAAAAGVKAKAWRLGFTANRPLRDSRLLHLIRYSFCRTPCMPYAGTSSSNAGHWNS